MSNRINQFFIASSIAIFILGCGGARKQVPVAVDEAPVAEPAITLGTLAEVGSAPIQLTNHPSSNGLGSYHPNGSQIVFQSDRDGRWQVYQLDLVTGAEELLIGSSGNDENPMWLPDSSGVLFVSDRDNPGSEYSRDIYFFDPVAIVTARLTEETADDWFPVPINSTAFYFLSERGSSEAQSQFDTPNGLYRGSLDGTPASLIAGLDVNPSAPADLEDGSLLVRTNDGQLAKLNQDGGLELLTPLSLKCGTVSYSHVRKIAVLNARLEDEYHLYLFDVNSRIFQEIETGGRDVRYPQFSPDGNKILYSREVEGNFQLFQVELAQ